MPPRACPAARWLQQQYCVAGVRTKRQGQGVQVHFATVRERLQVRCFSNGRPVRGERGEGALGWQAKRPRRVPGVTEGAAVLEEQQVTQGFGGSGVWDGADGLHKGFGVQKWSAHRETPLDREGELPRGRRESWGQREFFVVGLAEGCLGGFRPWLTQDRHRAFPKGPAVGCPTAVGMQGGQRPERDRQATGPATGGQTNPRPKSP